MPIQFPVARHAAECPLAPLSKGKARHRAPRHRQQGFGLFAVVMLTSALCLSLIVGYAGVLTRQEANGLFNRNQTFVNDAVLSIERAWPRYAAQFDDYSGSNPTQAEDVLLAARVKLRGPATAHLSKVVSLAGERIAYRSILLMYPTDTDADNPPDIANFIATGNFVSCADASKPCDPRAYAIFTSMETERRMSKETQLRLQKVAQKAQSYFKARTLQDPEKNISVNYFRRPMGNCDVLPQDLGCLDTFSPLATVSGVTGYTRTPMAVNLGLTDEELFSTWGTPIEASNLVNSSTAEPPYSMVFRARRPGNPFGTFFTVHAIQQI